MEVELKTSDGKKLGKRTFIGAAIASASLFAASSIQDNKYEKASKYCHRERRKNAIFTTRTARQLIREVFPDSQNRNIAIHLHPFDAKREDIISGVVEGTRMLSEATRSKFVALGRGNHPRPVPARSGAH